MRCSKQILFFGIGLLMIGCGNGHDNMGHRISHNSPKALFDYYHVALQERDYSAIMGCIEPSWQSEMEKMLVACRQYDDDARSLRDLIKERFGTDLAQQWYQRRFSPFSSERDWIYEGYELAWEEMKLHTEGDRAYVTVNGVMTGPGAGMLGGKWYIAVPKERSQGKSVIELQEAWLGDYIALLRKTTNFIKAGTINSENAESVLIEGQSPN